MTIKQKQFHRPIHQQYESEKERLASIDLLRVGSFEEEEFAKSRYQESNARPHSRGRRGGRPRSDKSRKNKCLRCEVLFHAVSKYNRLCFSCGKMRDFLGGFEAYSITR